MTDVKFVLRDHCDGEYLLGVVVLGVMLMMIKDLSELFVVKMVFCFICVFDLCDEVFVVCVNEG